MNIGFSRLISGCAVLWLVIGSAVSIGQPDGAAPDTPSWDGTYRRVRVPIVMYHYISSPPDDADAYRRDLSTPPDAFRAQMEYLFYQGYSAIALDDLDRALLTGMPLPAKPIILTFDDGYVDQYSHAFPILREFGFSGTFFIITARADAGDPAYLSWSQIAEMAAAGMHMASHTKDHPDLRGRDYDFLVYQILGSLESLAAYTGRMPDAFAYPAGQYDDAVLAVLETTPVRRAVTTQPGMLHTTDNRLELARLRISAGMTVRQFAALIGE
jgi:peptidoglycan/xylan/chitin deacetylase (PgdA/CDA1 family)